MLRVMRAVLAAFVCFAVWCAPMAASADCLPTLGWDPTPGPDAPVSTTGPAANDRRGRVVAPVNINGQGPYRFIVDTGANRSALSAALLSELGLEPDGEGEVHSVHGVVNAPLVPVNLVRYRDLDIPSQRMPVLGDVMLAGEQGLLGVDGMAGRRLYLDFERRCVEIGPSRGPYSNASGWSSVRGELRFGHLVVLRARVAGSRVNVLLDTGSDATMATYALRGALSERLRRYRHRTQTVAYTASEPVTLDHVVHISELRLGHLRISNVAAYVGDFYIFRLWGLDQEPTLLIGMDVLSQMGAIAIDYGNGAVHFRERRTLRRAPP